MIRRDPMSNLTSKITDTYFPKDEQHFFKLFLRFLLVTFGGAAFVAARARWQTARVPCQI